MKKIKLIISFCVTAVALSSCNKYLDVNDNPNSATNSTPDLILPQALTASAGIHVSFNTYGGWLVGYYANAGGFGGWGETFTYQFTTSNNTGLWSGSYDILNDYQYIINNTEGIDEYAYFNAAAKIMKVLNYQALVDIYGNIPYSTALLGAAAVTPTYDDAKTIYADLAATLDNAISVINGAQFPTALGSSDVLFRGDVTNWIKLANTLKLKLYIRSQGTGVFSGSPTISAEGFLTTDALVNPRYEVLDGKQNPMWNTYHSSYTQAEQAYRSVMPTYYALGLYNGEKILDEGRGSAVYRQYPTVPASQLGETPDNLGTVAGTLGSSPWYIGTPGAATGAANTIGTLKGASAGLPIFTAAESYFLQSEAALHGLITGDYELLFESGIKASYEYLHQNVNGQIAGTYNSDNYLTEYKADNGTLASYRYLVNIDMAGSDEQRLEAIITQKYIALNNIAGQEAWAEYRRTSYPRTVSPSIDASTRFTSFVSTESTLTNADGLPARVLYPLSEYNLNGGNVPQNINISTSYVFWDWRAN